MSWLEFYNTSNTPRKIVPFMVLLQVPVGGQTTLRSTWDYLGWQVLGSWSIDIVSKQTNVFVSWEFVGHWMNPPDSYEPSLESFPSGIQAILHNGIQFVHLWCYPGTPSTRYSEPREKLNNPDHVTHLFQALQNIRTRAMCLQPIIHYSGPNPSTTLPCLTLATSASFQFLGSQAYDL